MIYKNEKAKQILNFIEEYGSATATIIGNLFYSNCNDPTYNASRRMKTLAKEGCVKKYKPDLFSPYIYFIQKPLSEHNIKVLEVYSKLSTLGTIELFDKEVKVPCNPKNRVNDAVVILKREDDEYEYRYLLIIEVDKSSNTTSAKIRNVTLSGYYQDKYGLEPTWIITKKADIQERYYVKEANIIYTNWQLEQVNNNIFEV